MIGEKELWITPRGYIFDRGEGYNHTKVLELVINKGDEQLPLPEQPTTWASLLRTTVTVLQEYIDAEVNANESIFKDNFNSALKMTIKSNDLKANTSFSDELFTQPTHIRSSVYRNNKNSLCKIYDIPDSTESEYITAVYSGEVVWVLNALTTALEDYDISIVVKYINRNDLKALAFSEEDNEPDEENTQETFIKGNANIFISLLILKIDSLLDRGVIAEDEHNQMRIWADKVAQALIEAKSFTTLISKISKELDEKLGN